MVQRIYQPEHQPPGPRGVVSQRDRSAAPCPEEGRITALERRVEALETQEPSREIVTTRELPRDQIERIDRIEREWQRVQRAPDVTVPRGMAELFEGLEAIGQRIQALEQRKPEPINITPPAPTTSTTTEIEELRTAVQDNSATLANALAVIMDRCDEQSAHIRVLKDDLKREQTRSAFLERELRNIHAAFERATA